MNKLKLRLDDLQVDTFQTTYAPKQKGTVVGEQQCTCWTACGQNTCPGCPTCDASCNGTCAVSCNGSCAATCDASCYGTCDYSCDCASNETCDYTCAVSCGSCQFSCPDVFYTCAGGVLYMNC